MPAVNQPNSDNAASWLLGTGQRPSNLLRDTNSPGPLTNTIGLGVLLAIAAGGGSLAVALVMLRRWRRQTRARMLEMRRSYAAMGDDMHMVERGEARKKRIQSAKDDVEIGYQCSEDDEWEKGWGEHGSEDFAEERGLGIHFLDVDLRK